MVVGHLHDDLLRPDLLVDQLVAIVNSHDEVDCALEDQRFVLRDVQAEKEWIFSR